MTSHTMTDVDHLVLAWTMHEKSRTSELKFMWRNKEFLACDDDNRYSQEMDKNEYLEKDNMILEIHIFRNI